MKRLAALAIATLGLAGCAGSQTLSQQEFTQEFVHTLEYARAGLKITIVRDLEVQVQPPGEPPRSVHLGEAYAEYLQDPQQLRAITRKCVDEALAPSASGRLDR